MYGVWEQSNRSVWIYRLERVFLLSVVGLNDIDVRFGMSDDMKNEVCLGQHY